MMVQWVIAGAQMYALAKIYYMANKERKCNKFGIALLLSLSLGPKLLSCLACFNDSISSFFLVLSLYYWLNNRLLAFLFFSIALSIKMSALLMLPGFLLTACFRYGPVKTLVILVFIATFQILIALPFILENPQAYFSMAFDLGRKFDHK